MVDASSPSLDVFEVMRASQPSNKALKRLEEASTSEAVQRLMDGDVEGSQSALDRAELAKRLRNHRRETSPAEWLVPVVVALLCGVMASVLAVYRIPTVNVAATVNCTSMSFAPAQTLAWNGDARFTSDAFRYEKFFVTLAPLEPGEKPGSDNGRGSLGLAKGDGSLKTMVFEPSTKVALEVDRSGQLQVFSSRGQVEAQVVFWGQVQLELESDGELQSDLQDIEVPETLYLARTDRGVVPSLLEFAPPQGFELPLVEVDGVSFSKEVLQDGLATFEPSIIEAEVSILDTDETTLAGPSQALSFVGFQGQIRRLKVGKEIKLSLTGTAEDIVLASGTVERSLAPTYLSYMYRNQQITLVWSGVMFLWGMLWSVGRFVARR